MKKSRQVFIGLEIHAQLKTKSKMFCSCPADIWQAEPNTRVCPTCLGLPGALPTINKRALEEVLLLALALNCRINQRCYFERKNYFYPDLPKGYQITQHRRPLGEEGFLPLGARKIKIFDVHLEEDTGKTIHFREKGEAYSLLDFNKSGLPLVEIVSAPELRSADEAVAYCQQIQRLLRFLDISEADLEKGQLRFEVNLSLGTGPQLPSYRVEVKNLNSFRFVRKAIEFEIKRQEELLRKGVSLTSETRGFDEEKEVTIRQRSKEAALDYRYFPEPDLPPLEIDSTWLKKIGQAMPELPWAAEKRLQEKFKLRADEARIISQEKKWLQFFDQAVALGLPPARVARTLVNRPQWRDRTAAELAAHWAAEEKNRLRNQEELQKVVAEVLAAAPAVVADWQKGKKNALNFLLGQVMRQTQGRADPQLTRELLEKALGKLSKN